MKRWKPRRLDQLGTVGRGRSRHRPRNDPSLYGGAIPFFQTGDITAAEFHLRHYSQTYNEAGLAQSKMWPAEVLCITIAANIAESAVLAIPGCFPDSVVGFVHDPAESDVRFVKYLLDHAKWRMQAISKGTTQDNLSLEKLLSIGFLVPPVETQQRIADVLFAYDDLVENNTRRIAILEDMARRLFEEWFVRFRAPSVDPARLVDSSLGPIPEGWEVSTIGDVTSYVNRGIPPHYSNEAQTIVINQKCIRGQRLSLEQTRRQDKAVPADKLVRTHDVLINSTGVGTLGRVAQVAAIPDGCTVDTHVTIVRPIGEIDPHFFGLALLRLEPQFTGAGIGSTGQTELQRERIKAAELVVPPRAQRSQFGKMIAPMRRLSFILEEQNRNLRAQRDLLLPKLISGEIDVSAAGAKVQEAAE